MNLIPVENVIIVEPFYDKERVTNNGIVIPATAKNEKVVPGRVLKVGPGKVHLKSGKLIPVQVKVGQIVYYYISSAIEYKDGSVKYHFIDESIIVAVEE